MNPYMYELYERNRQPETKPEIIIPKVRVDMLHKGQRFRCISGRLWTFERKDSRYTEKYGGIIWANCDDGKTDCFAGCALVELLQDS